MNEPLALVIDVGTQSLRTSLVNTNGKIIAIVKHKYDKPYTKPKPGWFEQDPDYYYQTIIDCLKKLTSTNKLACNDIVGMTLTCFRDTAVLLDKDYKPLSESIMWFDQRMAKASQKLPLAKKVIIKLVGMGDTVLLNQRKAVAIWYQQNQPQLWDKVDKFVALSTYLNYKLINVLGDSASAYTGHYPLNFKKRKWAKASELKNVYNVETSKLAKLFKEGDVIGYSGESLSQLTNLPTNIPFIASGSDKSCETLGNGCIDNNFGSISYGTASTITVTSKNYREPEKFLPAYPSCISNYYNSEVQIYRGYWMLGWFGKEFAQKELEEANIANLALEEVLNKKIAEIPAGSEGLILQPYWGAGLKRPLAKGTIIGFSEVHTKLHFYRAIIEGIAYALKEGLLSIQKSQHHKINKLVISGGGSQSDIICQITADIFNTNVVKIQTTEATTIGAAICIFLAKNIFKSVPEAITSLVHYQSSYQPNSTTASIYDKLFKNVYTKIYPQNKRLHKQIKLLNGEITH
jgi:sugar (pentulose or hexulose) kinase